MTIDWVFLGDNDIVEDNPGLYRSYLNIKMGKPLLFPNYLVRNTHIGDGRIEIPKKWLRMVTWMEEFVESQNEVVGFVYQAESERFRFASREEVGTDTKPGTNPLLDTLRRSDPPESIPDRFRPIEPSRDAQLFMHLRLEPVRIVFNEANKSYRFMIEEKRRKSLGITTSAPKVVLAYIDDGLEIWSLRRLKLIQDEDVVDLL